jgi:branched-chain amino acid aminotransferase
MRTKPRDRAEEIRRRAEVLAEVGETARIFLSMPVVPGITPRLLLDPDRSEAHPDRFLERRHGTFAVDEVGLPCYDHLVLYGDGCFEGILIHHGRVFLLKEHLDRLWDSARRLEIEIPYTRIELVQHLLESAREVDFPAPGNGYLRLVVSRGIGDLGINPRKCVAPTVFSLASTIRLYPREMYETGIAIGLARNVRRADALVLDPTIKSNNYLNNVLGLIDGTRGNGTLEALMLTREGFVAEATVDNVFLIERHPGWESDPSQVEVWTPRREYCLNGITRALILRFARAAGYRVDEEADILPLDIAGTNRECLMTGTGAGVMPIIKVGESVVGDGVPGPITLGFVEQMRAALANPAYGLALSATTQEIESYLAAPGTLPEESARYRPRGSIRPSPEYA